jgi:hypothetical protein
VLLQALEGGNQAEPPEFKASPSAAIAQNCTSQGGLAQADWLSTSYTRTNPTAGIWDLHVFGLYSFNQSPYTLDVQFAKVTSDKMILDGTSAADLDTTFKVSVDDASYGLVLDASQSTFTLASFNQKVSSQVAQDAKVRVPNKSGAVARTYDDSVSQVTIATGGSTGNDIDLAILECDDQALATCVTAGTSGTPTDVESVMFTPKAGKFYAAEVAGYAIKTGGGAFALTERVMVKKPDVGTVTLAHPDPKTFNVTTALDAGAAKLLADPRYTGGLYEVQGSIELKDDGGASILSIPVRVQAPAAPAPAAPPAQP